MKRKVAKGDRSKKAKPAKKSRAELAQAAGQQKRASFLTALADTGNICRACEVTGVGRSTVYGWREDALFERQFQSAIEESTERLELEARRRAFEGVKKPVYQGGNLVGYVQEYSDTLLIFLLKGLRPDKYRDNAKVEHSGGIDLQVSVTVAET